MRATHQTNISYMMDALKRYEGKTKSNISRGMVFENYTSFSYETNKAIIKIMTTLLTHNAVVSILMENFQKNYLKIIENRS